MIRRAMSIVDALFGIVFAVFLWLVAQVFKGLWPAVWSRFAVRIERWTIAWLRKWQTGRISVIIKVRGRFVLRTHSTDSADRLDRILTSVHYERKTHDEYTLDYQDPTNRRVSEVARIDRDYGPLERAETTSVRDLRAAGLVFEYAVDGRVSELDEVLDVVKTRVDLMRETLIGALGVAVELPRSEIILMLPKELALPRLGREERRRVTYELEGSEMLSCSIDPVHNEITAELDGFRKHPMTVRYLSRTIAEALYAST